MKEAAMGVRGINRIAPLYALMTLWGALALPAQEIGPRNGALVISGGGGDSTGEIYKRFVELAGGPEAPIVVIPTSSADSSCFYDMSVPDCRFDESYRGLRPFRALGCSNLTVFHTRDRTLANDDEFVGPIRRARGVWLQGGSHWKHADAYLETKVHQELHALLDRGGVIGGGSAGAHIQGDFMNVSRSPDREFGERTLPKEKWRQGFKFLRNVVIDVHVLARNRQFDLIGVIRSNPHLLGIGVDESTAIVVRGDEFEVIGASYALIYDNTSQLAPDREDTFRTVGGSFYFLRPGDTFNLKTREAFRPTVTRRPLNRVLKKNWGQLP
jgi:cyanophycinase